MTKFFSFCVIVMTTLVVAWKMLDSSMEDSLGFGAILAQERVLQDQAITDQLFRQTLRASVDALQNGRLSLREAHNKVLAAALEYNPEYLRYLRLAEGQQNIHDCVALNLVDHVRMLEEETPNPRSHLPALEAQLREMLSSAR